MDWWGQPAGADTEKEDEIRYQHMLWLLRCASEFEVVDAEHAAWDSVVNGGTGIFTIRGIE